MYSYAVILQGEHKKRMTAYLEQRSNISRATVDDSVIQGAAEAVQQAADVVRTTAKDASDKAGLKLLRGS
ncbi:MAG: hypothetical protein FRX49_03970 [Trebouxia sp. A1-2]|nr:MAG: hypothetical protein FRX49_03970 [Trebouxia sp. A1-2]